MLTHRSCPAESCPSLIDLVPLNGRDVLSLNRDASAYAYCLGFAVVETLARESPELLTAEVLSVQPGESPGAYLERLGVPSESRLRRTGRALTQRSDPVLGFLRRMRPFLFELVRSCRSRFAGQDDFLASLDATATSGSREYDLETYPDFLRLVSECWQ
jgi:hypothetical protein